MTSKHFTRPLAAIAVCAMLWGCATSPEVQQRQQTKAERIEAILTEPSDFKEAERCLSSSQFRDIHILDDQHIVFEGRRDQLWLNTLTMRCPSLRRDSVLRIERLSGLKLCRLDSFSVHDWFEWPWYRRWPWRWASGPKCALGDFQPVTQNQVDQLEAAIKAARG